MNSKKLIGVAGIVVFLLLILLVGVDYGKTSEPDRNKIHTEDKNDAWKIMKIYVEQRVDTIDDIIFPGDGQRSTTDLGKRRYKIVSYVDTKNSLGTKKRIPFEGIMKKKENDWTLENLTFKKYINLPREQTETCEWYLDEGRRALNTLNMYSRKGSILMVKDTAVKLQKLMINIESVCSLAVASEGRDGYKILEDSLIERGLLKNSIYSTKGYDSKNSYSKHQPIKSIPGMSDTDMLKNCKEGCSIMCLDNNSCDNREWIQQCVYSCTH